MRLLAILLQRTSLKSGDIITSVNGISTNDLNKFSNYLSYISPNQKQHSLTSGLTKMDKLKCMTM